jgi:hypothetical protein
MSADRARQAVSEASQLLNQQRTDAALLMLRGAMRRLPTRDDSISALYYMSQGLVQKADRENDAPARARACAILRLIRRDPQHKLAADIRNLYQSQACN